MGSIVVRGLDDVVKQKFREVAAAEGSSMEGLLRTMIEEKVAADGGDTRNSDEGSAVSPDLEQHPWIVKLENLGRAYGGIELDTPVLDWDLTQLRPEVDFSER